MPSLRFPLALFTLVIGFAVPASAAPQALIIVGLAAGDSQASRLNESAQAIRTGLIARGITPGSITILGAPDGPRARREQILGALKTLAAIPADSPADERWVVLLGTANASAGAPSFQISGPRLSAADLAAAVKLLPGAKRVVIGTSASGGFLPPLLALPDLEAVAATSDSGEVNEPRFIGEWASALATNPRAPFAELAAITAERVKAFYEGASLAQGENARLIFRPANDANSHGAPAALASARIIEPPFPRLNLVAGTDNASPKAVASTPPRSTPAPNDEPSGISVSDIQIPKPKGDGDIERRPATDQTRALLAEARDATRDSQHAALFLRVDREITVGRDFGVFERHRFRAYLRTGEALDDLGTLWLPSGAGNVTRLDSARVITPDGSQILINPKAFDARRAEETREEEAAREQKKPTGPAAPPFLPLPEVTAGCIVEAEWTIERDEVADMPQFTREWSLAEEYPIRALHLTVTTPNEIRWRTFAPNLPKPTEGRDGPPGRPGTPHSPATTPLPIAVTADAHTAVEAAAQPVRITMLINGVATATTEVEAAPSMDTPATSAPSTATTTPTPDSNASSSSSASPAHATSRTQHWTLTDVAPLNLRPGDAPARTFIPWVGISSLESWDAFAAWYLRLATGSTETGTGVALLADEIGRAHTDRAGRLRAAYERVAALRYVSFPLGVGAIRARTPEQVWKQRYGDCKDKAGLLVAVLGKLGITAEFALVNRFDHTFTEWPAWQFNHAVARVPAAPADGQPLDLWLDTTDRLVPFGIVAPGDLGRDAFAFNAEGKATFYKITAAQEPKSEWRQISELNKTNRTLRLSFTASGAAETKMRQLFASLPANQRHEFLQTKLSPHFLLSRVTTTDPYDLGVPFKAFVEGSLLGDHTQTHQPRLIIPGLEQFNTRYAYGCDELWWDEGRTWLVFQGLEDSGIGFEIPGYSPALRTRTKPDGSVHTDGPRGPLLF